MSLAPGARLGPYEIIAAIGAGGMGEVYRARDTRLNRDVAIKVLPELFAQDADRLARFKREAQVLASISHPHIAGIYGLEEVPSASSGQGPINALVLEFVDGPTLADRIAQGAMPVEDALPIARQMCDALEAAHEHGIIHRDLKPANIKLTTDGSVKVLDFGLAKLAQASDSGLQASDMSLSPTLSSPVATRMGVLLGTAPYMSPEQAKGKPVDKRTDIWAFGCVLYEMLTGTRAFDGEDVTDALAAVVRGEPDWTRLPVATPPGIQKLLRRCLEKDRKRRFADIADVRFEIDEALHAPAQPSPTVAVAAGRRAPGWRGYILAAAAVITAVALTAAAMRMLAPQPQQPVRRFAVLLQTNEQFSGAARQVLDISPIGTHLVYASNGRLTLRALDTLDSVPMPGTDRAVAPFFSPDGAWIAFWQDGQLKKVAVSGGPPVTLCPWPNPFGGGWGPDGTITFSKGSEGVWSVPEGGGQATQLIKLDASRGESVDAVQVLPGNRGVLFTLTASASAGGQSIPRTESAQVVVQAANSSERKVLVRGASGGRYLSSGYLVYVRQGTMFAQSFDVDRLAATGNPIPVTDGVSEARAQGGVSGAGFSTAAQFTVSNDGVLAYVPSSTTSLERTLVWVDRQGKESAIAAPPRAYVYPRLSPDGTRVAIDVRDQEDDIHIWDLSRQILRRLTFDPNPDVAPLWAPDGQRVVFSAAGQGLAWRAADGTGSVEPLINQGAAIHVPTGFSPDGKILLFNEGSAGFDIKLLKLAAKPESATLLQTASNEMNAVMSPDGKWVAYQSNESGLENIYVRPFPDVQNGRWQISTEGGTRPAWNRNGEIFYLATGGTMMAVRVNTTKGFQPDNPVKLFSGPYYMGLLARTYDVTPDGQRFLMIKTPNQTATDAPRIILVENWFEELKRKVPVK